MHIPPPTHTHTCMCVCTHTYIHVYSGDKSTWLFYRNKVKFTITLAKQNFYSDKIEHNLQNGDCRKWWSFVNTLSGRSSKASPKVLEKMILLTLGVD